MKRITACLMILVSSYFVPYRAQAQDSIDEARRIYETSRLIRAFYRAARPFVNNFNLHLSRVHGVQIDTYNFESQYKRLYPKSYEYIQGQIARDRGLVNVSLPIVNSVNKIEVDPFSILIGLTIGEAQLILYFKNQWQSACRQDLINNNNFTQLEADKECNFQSDQVGVLESILIPLFPPGYILATLIEWRSEPGQRYDIYFYLFPRQRPVPQNQYKVPGGWFSGGPCGGPASVLGGFLTGETAGTDLPRFDGGVINVVADDPCRVGH